MTYTLSFSHSPAILLCQNLLYQEKKAGNDMFRNKNINMKNYSHLLEQENETLKYKISRLENERDRAVAEKVRMSELLEKYKGEYEALIADAKTLSDKQKKSMFMIDCIAEKYKDEIDSVVRNVCKRLDDYTYDSN